MGPHTKHGKTIDGEEFSSEESHAVDPDSPPNFEAEDPVEIVPPRENAERRSSKNKRKRSKREFNPWTELDKVSRKNVTRRDLISGLFRFLPREDDKK